MGNEKKEIGIFIAAIFVIFAFAMMPVEATPEVETQLAMLLDGSGSITPSNWNIIKEGVASAVENSTCLPQNGTVELTVIQFGYNSPVNARVEVAPVVITSANAGPVAAQIRAIPQGGDNTPMAHGFHLTADTLRASTNFDPGIKQAINLATDGMPNVLDPTFPSTDYKVNTVQARDYANATLLMTEDQDEIDAEGIAISDDNRNWLRDNIVYPQPGNIAPPFEPGWVRVVTSAQAFADSVCEKIIAIIIPPTPTPPPAPAPVPAITPIGIIALVGLLSVIAAMSIGISLRKKRR